jgi:hypothetical protein
MRLPVITTLFSLLFATPLLAQETVHDTHHHHEHDLELGVALNPVYMIHENLWTSGLHLHLVKNIGHTPWGIGLGYEHINDDHQHSTFGVVGSYRFTPEWVVNISPGVTFERQHRDELFPAVHFESAYEFLIGEVHVGPAIEYAWDPNDSHFSIGLHLGLGL